MGSCIKFEFGVSFILLIHSFVVHEFEFEFRVNFIRLIHSFVAHEFNEMKRI